MRLAVVSTVLAIALAGCAGCAGEFVQRPPARYQHDATVIVRLHPANDIARDCAELGAVHRGSVVGCFAGLGVQLPNPCEWPDPFAQLFCHELAHANGWPADHPRE